MGYLEKICGRRSCLVDWISETHTGDPQNFWERYASRHTVSLDWKRQRKYGITQLWEGLRVSILAWRRRNGTTRQRMQTDFRSFNRQGNIFSLRASRKNCIPSNTDFNLVRPMSDFWSPAVCHNAFMLIFLASKLEGICYGGPRNLIHLGKYLWMELFIEEEFVCLHKKMPHFSQSGCRVLYSHRQCVSCYKSLPLPFDINPFNLSHSSHL